MANFLEQFESKNYKKENVVVKDERPKASEEIEAKSFSGVGNTDQDVVIDTSYNKHKTIRIAIIASAALLICIAGFFGFRFFNRVQILNFEGKGISEARTWALKNNLQLDEQLVFDNKVSSDVIISQAVKAGEKVVKKSVLTLTISKGADPDEKIEVPDFSTINAGEIQAWIDTNKLTNTNITQQNSDTIPKGTFIKAEYRDIAVNKDNFKRKDYLTIYASKGSSVSDTSVTLPNFVGMTKTAADEWATSKNITIKYTEQVSTSVAKDKIISQDKEVGATVESASTISLTVSAGEGVLVPSFSNVSMEEAPGINSLLAVTVKKQYSNTVPYGKFISQSVSVGKRVLPAENKVTVTYSEGKPYIGNLVGTLEKDLAAYFYAFTQKGTKITYTVTYVDGSEDKGLVVWASKYNEYISFNENVSIKVSKGNLPRSTP
jgi:serine/threonine-protein kinase